MRRPRPLANDDANRTSSDAAPSPILRLPLSSPVAGIRADHQGRAAGGGVPGALSHPGGGQEGEAKGTRGRARGVGLDAASTSHIFIVYVTLEHSRRYDDRSSRLASRSSSSARAPCPDPGRVARGAASRSPRLRRSRRSAASSRARAPRLWRRGWSGSPLACAGPRARGSPFACTWTGASTSRTSATRTRCDRPRRAATSWSSGSSRTRRSRGAKARPCSSRRSAARSSRATASWTKSSTACPTT